MSILRLVLIGLVIGLIVWVGFVALVTSQRSEPEAILTAPPGAETVTLLPFEELGTLDPLPPGWSHRTFWLTRPTDYALTAQGGRPALACTTVGSGSILTRATAIPIDAFPTLRWAWFVEEGLPPSTDEATRAGDDHPVRLFLRFAGAAGRVGETEIVWSNGAFRPGQYKVIGNFPHLVADGGARREGAWQDQAADLTELHARATGGGPGGILTAIGVFCDSDDTGGTSRAFTGPVTAHSAPLE